MSVCYASPRLRCDPSVLLRSDVAAADEATRERLTESLLTLMDRHELLDWQRGLSQHYRKLAHERLGLQLMPYVKDRTKGFLVRRFALEVAEKVKVRSLIPVAISVALDPTDDRRIRGKAALLVESIGSDEDKTSLLQLVRCSDSDDPDDELLGIGLMACWPRSITATELFGLLRNPKRPNYHGMYQSFIYNELVPGLPTEALSAALDWVINREYRHTELGAMVVLADRIIAAAWDAAKQSSGLLPQLAATILCRFKQYGPAVRRRKVIDSEPLWEDTDPQRRDLLRELVKSASSSDYNASHLLYTEPPAAIYADIPWMLRVVRDLEGVDLLAAWVGLIWSAFAGSGFAFLDSILAAMDVPAIAEAFGPAMQPVALDSEIAAKGRAELKQQKEAFAHRKRQPDKGQGIANLTGWLDRAESGHPDEWWCVVRAMATAFDHHGNLLVSDVRSLPGWERGSADIRSRIVTTARAYLSAATPSSERWFGKNEVHLPAIAGYQAFVLLLEEVPDVFAQIPSQLLRRWTDAIIGFPASTAVVEYDRHQLIVHTAYRKARPEVIEAFGRVVEMIHRAPFYDLWVFGRCWDDDLVRAAIQKLQQPELEPDVSLRLLEEMLKHASEKALPLALPMLSLPLPADSAGRERCRSIAAALLEHAPRLGCESRIACDLPIPGSPRSPRHGIPLIFVNGTASEL